MSSQGEGARQERLGFVGLGNMGFPMCRRLVDAGYDVVAFDLRPDVVDSIVANGATAAGSARQAASQVDVLLTSLPEPHHVDAVMRHGGALDALGEGALWIDLTTNRRELVQELAAGAAGRVDVVDSPVTGAVDGARTGNLTLFAGGDPAPLARATPILSRLGRVIECGALGSGNVVKLVTNQLWFVHAAALGEAFALGVANGVDLAVIYDAIRGSVADSFVARHDAPSIFAGHYDPSFPLALCLKDLGLIAEISSVVGTELPMTESAHRVFTAAAERYGPAAGEMHVARQLEDAADLSFRLAGDWTPPWEVDQ